MFLLFKNFSSPLVTALQLNRCLEVWCEKTDEFQVVVPPSLPVYCFIEIELAFSRECYVASSLSHGSQGLYVCLGFGSK